MPSEDGVFYARPAVVSAFAELLLQLYHVLFLFFVKTYELFVRQAGGRTTNTKNRVGFDSSRFPWQGKKVFELRDLTWTENASPDGLKQSKSSSRALPVVKVTR